MQHVDLKSLCMTISSLQKLVKHFCTVFGLTLFQRAVQKTAINLVAFILLWRLLVIAVLKYSKNLF